MRRIFRSAGLVFAFSACAVAGARAQTTPQLVFTSPIPVGTSSPVTSQEAPIVEERGLALWAGTTSDIGVGVTIAGPRWTVRFISSMTALPVDGHQRPTFQQLEMIGPLLSLGSASIAAGGGVREEWDGTRVLIGRLLAGSDLRGGRLQGSLVIERATASFVRHDAADLVTTVGWLRSINARVSGGIEGIGQDLEGFWNPAEADGGAKLLVGPSVHLQSRKGDWAVNVTAGPVFQTLSTAASAATKYASGGRHVGIFASASWIPSFHQ